MKKTEKYEADLFGQKFVLTTNDGKKDDLEKVANYYKKVVDVLLQKLPDRPQLDIAILAGLKVTDKLYSLANSRNVNVEDQGDEKIHDIVNDIIKRLDVSLGL